MLTSLQPFLSSGRWGNVIFTEDNDAPHQKLIIIRPSVKEKRQHGYRTDNRQPLSYLQVEKVEE